jgi:hypothetical protein
VVSLVALRVSYLGVKGNLETGKLHTIAFVSGLVLFAVLSFVIFRELTREVVLVEPFSVPKSFQDAGFTSDVLASRIAESIRLLEKKSARPWMKTENFSLSHDEILIPEVTVPGANVSVKALTDLVHTLFGKNLKHVTGDVTLPINASAIPSSTLASNPNLKITVYVTEGRHRSDGKSVSVPLDEDKLVQLASEAVLEQIDPFLLGVYRFDDKQYKGAIQAFKQASENPSASLSEKADALMLLGFSFSKDNRNDEAISTYKRVVSLVPQYSVGHTYLGRALREQKNFKQAIEQFRIAANLSPKEESAHRELGDALRASGNTTEADAELKKADDMKSVSK